MRAAVIVVALGLACSGPARQSAGAASPPDKTVTSADVALLELVDEVFERRVSRSPQLQTRLGRKTGYHRWDDISEAHRAETNRLERQDLEALRTRVDRNALSASSRLTYDLFEYQLEERLAGHQWRHHSYPVNQMYGYHTAVPSFLINYHHIESEADARAYVARQRAVSGLFGQLTAQLQIRESKGVLPPAFVFPRTIDSARRVITGSPFDDSGKPSTLLRDFLDKLDDSELAAETKKALIAEAKAALRDSTGPAYRKLIAFLGSQAKRATRDDGAWKLPDGGTYYDYRLRTITTTDMTAEQIHELGQKEVARIHGEMRAIVNKVGFKGALPAFFEHLRTAEQFYYPNTDAGRAAYLERATKIIDVMRGRLDELFLTKPKAAIEVKRVESFRERSAGKAFYSRPTEDGKKPGTYYANLYDMRDMPRYQMEALAYHEGIPGHHMQLSIAQELKKLPRFRRYSGFTAYSEGWALYAERVAKEIGMYADPYSDFGRLAMELWRACRLVVDTGIHVNKWTREQAIDYLMKNTPNPRGDAVKAIERYIVI
ncbi:MAG: DUF885 domain-containing protein, partial [Deltaproteobacteria bacterium]|nr:DUF885 domain-containing protein [Deltaproteobacteria bacterium]